MIKIQQLIKTLNNTEAGKTKTKDSYLRMTKGVDIDDFFPHMERNFFYVFKRRHNLSDVKIRVEKCHDGIRIYNIGQISNANAENLWGGDKIILEKRIYDNDEPKYFIDCKRENDSIYFQKFKDIGFELLTPQKLKLSQNCQNLQLLTLGKMRKRSDSDETEVYKILINGTTVSHNLDNSELLKIHVKNNECLCSKTKSWEYYQFIMET